MEPFNDHDELVKAKRFFKWLAVLLFALDENFPECDDAERYQMLKECVCMARLDTESEDEQPNNFNN